MTLVARVSVVAVSLLLGGHLACKATPQPSGPQPHVEPAAADPWASGGTATAPRHAHAVLRPVFVVEATPLQAGTAFVVRPKGGGPLLITAHHLFGPAGGLDRTLSWQDMPRVVRSVRARSIDDESVIVVGGAPLAVEGAEGMSERRIGGDLAIFPITELGPAQPLELAEATPKVGDRVVLLAAVRGDRRTRHPATVIEVGKEHVSYAFDDQIALRATSGAPVVDGAERVVAINLGGGALDDGRIMGIGSSIGSFGPQIERAVAAAR